MNDHQSIIFASLEPWDDIWRRNQFVCAELSRRYPQSTILFVGPAFDLSNSIRTMRWAGLTDLRARTVQGFPNIVATQPIKLLPNSMRLGRAVNDWLLVRHVRRGAERLGIQKPILWLNSHAAVHLLGQLEESAVIYDVTDDWTALNQPEGVRLRTIQQDAELCRRADAVIVCSKRLEQLKQPLARSVHLIPNGVDVEHYRSVQKLTGILPAESSRWAKPVFGYTGTVHPDRVDVELLIAISERLKSGSLVFVGPNHMPEETARRLTTRGNIHFTGPVPYQQIPQHMRAFDVCMVPHVVSPFTESLNPIKLWEYLAAGKPIVSTPVAGFRDYPQFVRLASTADEFIAALQASLEEDPSLSAARQSEAANHSWKSRVDQIELLIHRVVHQHRAQE